MTCLLALLLIAIKYYHIISNSIGVMACTRFLLQGRQLHNKESESCLSCMRHAYWSSSSSLPNIIKLSQTVWELWPAQDFGFRGDNYIMKTVRVVSRPRWLRRPRRPGGCGFNPRRGRQHSFVEIDHKIFSTVILSLPLIQEGQLSVSGERMCTILVNRLED